MLERNEPSLCKYGIETTGQNCKTWVKIDKLWQNCSKFKF